MKTFRQIIDDKIVNRAVFEDSGLPADWPDPEQWEEEVETEDVPQIGWTRVDGVWTAPPPETELAS